MKLFANLKIRLKMLVCFSLLIAMMIALVVIGMLGMLGISNDYTATINGPLAVHSYLVEYQNDFRDVKEAVAKLVIYAGIDSDKCATFADSASSSFNNAISGIDAASTANSANLKLSQKEKNDNEATIKNIKDLLNQYKSATMQPIIDAAKNNDRDKAMQIYQAENLVPKIKEPTHALIDETSKISTQYVGDAKHLATRDDTTLIIVAAAATAVAVIVAVYISRFVGNLVVPMAAFFKNAGTVGDLSLSETNQKIIAKYMPLTEEMGNLSNGALMFVLHIGKVAEQLKKIAGGDLTVEIEALSDADVIGQSLKQMVASLNSMFVEVNDSSINIASGSKQVAEGSQILAQGATEQSASTKQLTDSIVEMSNKTKASAEMANQAANLASTIKTNAEKGSLQMDAMIDAVNEINAASQSIIKVIKVIDDIAFQTNILALNAAVEAARAGQHGTGFAVVAEEVRNLAAKSAEAAKETGDMIQDSVEKAELGSRIAMETASSLTEIVAGINESSLIIEQIARSSEEQSRDINQINYGINEVAQVVDKNSAASQESAAASEEMSAQATVLENLVAQFKLKG